MAEPKEVEKKSNTLKYSLIGVGVFLLVILIILTATGQFNPPKQNPLDQFTTQRNCSFLVMDNVSKAICTDGTVWDVTQIGSPVPLPQG